MKLLRLALQAIDDADAAVVLADALEEIPRDEHAALEQRAREALGVRALEAQALAAVLLFGGLPTAEQVLETWPVVARCQRGPLSLLERLQRVGRRHGVVVVATVPEEDGALRVVVESADAAAHSPTFVSQLYDALREALPRGVGLRLDYRIPGNDG